MTWHNQWLQAVRASEANIAIEDDTTILIPRRFDVVFGRGRGNRDRTGNLRAAHLVEMHSSKYEQANKHKKTEIAERIVTIIHESYGRFLKWQTEGYVEVSHETAREKVSHMFRHFRAKQQSNSKPPELVTIDGQ